MQFTSASAAHMAPGPGSVASSVISMPVSHTPNVYGQTGPPGSLMAPGPGSVASSVISMPVSHAPGMYGQPGPPGSEGSQYMLFPVAASGQGPPYPSSSYSSYPTTDAYSTPSTGSMYPYIPSPHPYSTPSSMAPQPEVPAPPLVPEADVKRVVEGPIAELAPRRPKLGNNVDASCPIVGALHRGSELPELLPVITLKFRAQVHIAVVMVEVELETEAPDHLGKAHRLALYCPKTAHTTFTEARVENLSKPQNMATTVLVPMDEVQTAAPPYRPPYDNFDDPNAGPDYDDPNLFIFEVPPQFAFKAGNKLKVTLSYFEPLQFREGKYTMRLPSYIPGRCLPNRQPIQDILQVTASVDIGLPLDVDLECNQPVKDKEVVDDVGLKVIALDTDVQLTNSDFEMSYQVWGGTINAACYVQHPQFIGAGDAKDAISPLGPLISTGGPPVTDTIGVAQGGDLLRRQFPLSQMARLDQFPTFCLAVAPPDPQNWDRQERAVVFVLDRSGSMQGKPLEYAMQAMLVGLALLGKDDTFNACCFDHEQIWWREGLVEASRANIEECESWIQTSFSARGLTNIKEPLCQALDMLDGAQQLPFIFLLTDGCVADEKEICAEVDERLSSPETSSPHKPRINTFAIGPFANHFFLKRLALTARGLFDVAFRANSIQTQMEQMLNACAHPVLSDVVVRVPGLDEGRVAVLPQPLPDLFCGQPLLVVGKYEGEWPDQVDLIGQQPQPMGGGTTLWTQEVSSVQVDSRELPLGKIWAKAFLDHETVGAWRTDDKKAVQRIIATSLATGVPCPPYTQQVAIACSPETRDQMVADTKAGKRQKVVRYAIAGAAGVAIVAGAATVLSLGNLGMTMQNIPFDAFSGDCCQCCGECCGSLLGGGCVLS